MSRRSETETDLCCPDVVGIEGNILAATKDIESGLVMNCACHGQVRLNELVKQINLSRELRSIFHWDNLLNKNIEPIYANPRPGDILHSFANIDLIKKKFNFNPIINFVDGLGKSIELYS